MRPGCGWKEFPGSCQHLPPGCNIELKLHRMLPLQRQGQGCTGSASEQSQGAKSAPAGRADVCRSGAFAPKGQEGWQYKKVVPFFFFFLPLTRAHVH